MATLNIESLSALTVGYFKEFEEVIATFERESGYMDKNHRNYYNYKDDVEYILGVKNLMPSLKHLIDLALIPGEDHFQSLIRAYDSIIELVLKWNHCMEGHGYEADMVCGRTLVKPGWGEGNVYIQMPESDREYFLLCEKEKCMKLNFNAAFSAPVRPLFNFLTLFKKCDELSEKFLAFSKKQEQHVCKFIFEENRNLVREYESLRNKISERRLWVTWFGDFAMIDDMKAFANKWNATMKRYGEEEIYDPLLDGLDGTMYSTFALPEF